MPVSIYIIEEMYSNTTNKWLLSALESVNKFFSA